MALTIHNILGRCYTVSFLSESPIKKCLLFLKKNHDLISKLNRKFKAVFKNFALIYITTVFAHEKERVHRVVTSNIEKELETFDLQFKPDVFVIKFFMMEMKKRHLNKRSNPCQEYSKVESYDDCLKNLVWTNMKKNGFKCRLPGKNSLVKKFIGFLKSLVY